VIKEGGKKSDAAKKSDDDDSRVQEGIKCPTAINV
jgi:hypothetical protein